MAAQIKSCEGCGGACCREQESPPMYSGYLPGAAFEHEDNPDARMVQMLPEALKDELKRYMNRLMAGLKPYHPTWPACLWLDLETGKCRHYALRPSICRDELHRGDDGCRRWRKEYPR